MTMAFTVSEQDSSWHVDSCLMATITSETVCSRSFQKSQDVNQVVRYSFVGTSTSSWSLTKCASSGQYQCLICLDLSALKTKRRSFAISWSDAAYKKGCPLLWLVTTFYEALFWPSNGLLCAFWAM